MPSDLMNEIPGQILWVDAEGIAWKSEGPILSTVCLETIVGIKISGRRKIKSFPTPGSF